MRVFRNVSNGMPLAIFDDPAHQIEGDRIAPLRARIGDQRQCRQTIGKFREAGRGYNGFEAGQRFAANLAGADAEAIIFLEQGPLDHDIIAKACGVRQKIAYRYWRVRRASIKAFHRIDQHHRVFETGDEIGDILVEADLAVFDQHHRGHTRDRLGHRIDAEQAVGVHRAGFAASDCA